MIRLIRPSQTQSLIRPQSELLSNSASVDLLLELERPWLIHLTGGLDNLHPQWVVTQQFCRLGGGRQSDVIAGIDRLEAKSMSALGDCTGQKQPVQAYVAAKSGSKVALINMKTWQLLDLQPVGAFQEVLALDSDRGRVFVTSESETITVFKTVQAKLVKLAEGSVAPHAQLRASQPPVSLLPMRCCTHTGIKPQA